MLHLCQWPTNNILAVTALYQSPTVIVRSRQAKHDGGNNTLRDETKQRLLRRLTPRFRCQCGEVNIEKRLTLE